MRVKLTRAGWTWKRVLFVALAIVVVAYVGLSAMRYYLAYRDLEEAKDLLLAVETDLRENGLDSSPALLDYNDERLVSARGKLTAADDVLDQDPILQVARRLPWIGDQVEAADDLAEVGVEATDIGFHGSIALRTFDRLKEEERGALGEKAVVFLWAVRPDMAAIEENLDSIRSKLDGLRGDALLPRLSGALDELDAKIPRTEDLVETYKDADAFAPAFLGFDRPKTYLVLAQDNNELFPTGGFIPIYGLITLDHGRITRKFFEPVANLNGRWQEASGGEYVEPPGPLKRYLLRDHTWNLGVSNWSPDFPTAARQAQLFFAKASSEPIDGVMAINSLTLEELLKVLGSVTIEDYDVTVTADNVNEETLKLTRPSQEAGGERYAFTGSLADAVIEAAFNTGSDRWSDMLDTLDSLGGSRQLLVYMNDPEEQRLVRNLGWDGSIDGSPGDYLMVVNTSVNSTKLNLVLDESIEVDVAIDGAGVASHRVTLRYANGVSDWEKGRDAEFIRETMLEGFYGGYLRIYTQPDADFIDVVQDGEPIGFEEITVENGRAAAGRFFGLARDERTELAFLYDVPNSVRGSEDSVEYRLVIQKQPGTRAVPVTLKLGLPEGAEIVSAELDGRPITVDGSPFEISTDLGADRELVVKYDP
jgi:hypothetical protein